MAFASIGTSSCNGNRFETLRNAVDFIESSSRNVNFDKTLIPPDPSVLTDEEEGDDENGGGRFLLPW